MNLDAKAVTVGSQDIFCMGEDAPLQDIIDGMVERNVSTVLVLVPEEGDIAGIITERDLVHKILKEKREVKSLKASDVMTRAPLLSVEPGLTIAEVISVMSEHRVKSVPIIVKQGDFEDCTGLITQTDIIRALANRN